MHADLVLPTGEGKVSKDGPMMILLLAFVNHLECGNSLLSLFVIHGDLGRWVILHWHDQGSADDSTFCNFLFSYLGRNIVETYVLIGEEGGSEKVETYIEYIAPSLTLPSFEHVYL